VLGEADLILDVYYRSVVERRFAVELSEHLVLIGGQDQRVHLILPVYYRVEHKIQSALVVAYFPGLQIIDRARRVRYFENDLVQLVRFAAVKDHILRAERFAEPVSEIESERRSVDFGRQARPIPNVLIRPNASAPIESAASARKLVAHVAYRKAADALETVDLCVVIKPTGLSKRHCDGDIIAFRRFERYLAIEIVFAVEFAVMRPQDPFAAVVYKLKPHSVFIEPDVAAFRGLGHFELSFREQPHLALGYIRKTREVEYGHRAERHVRIIGDRQCDAVRPVAKIVVVPFLYAKLPTFDGGAAVGFDLRKRIAALFEIAARVEKLALGQNVTRGIARRHA